MGMKAYNYLHEHNIVAVEFHYGDKIRCFFSMDWFQKASNKEFGESIVLGRADFGRATLDESVAELLCTAYKDEMKLTETSVDVFKDFTKRFVALSSKNVN
jgi:hypothetical protein